MTIQHTPGPWEIDTATRPDEICTIHGVPPTGDEAQKWVYVRGALGYWDATPEERLANARLIAAAPDLLAALRTLVENGGIGPESMFHDARAAIAAAEGK